MVQFVSQVEVVVKKKDFMIHTKPILLKSLENVIQRLRLDEIPEERKAVLHVLVDYIQNNRMEGKTVNLNFICTHNSRRSQFSQIWAQTAADFYGVKANCFSGGVEVTAFNTRAVASVKRAGFSVSNAQGENPRFEIQNAENGKSILAFSKLFDDEINPKTNFAAIMTCAHADENCPFIPGAEARIPVRYEDPKAFDDTELESEKYDERSLQIATEMFYVFSKL